ncbi:unnamed protein product, partial [Thlaspi arvense]
MNPPSLKRAPIWATIQGIPFELITPEGLSFICRPLGKAVDLKPFKSINSAEVKVSPTHGSPLFALCVMRLGIKTLCAPTIIGPENKPAIPQSAKSPAHFKEKRKGKEIHEEQKAVWKPVANKLASSSETAGQSSEAPPVQESHYMTRAEPQAVLPAIDRFVITPFKTSEVPKDDTLHTTVGHLLQESSSLAVVETPFLPVLKPAHASASPLTRGPTMQTSNLFDILLVDDMAMVISDDPLAPDTYEPYTSSSSPARGRKKKRKMGSKSSPVTGGVLSRDGEKRHNL